MWAGRGEEEVDYGSGGRRESALICTVRCGGSKMTFKLSCLN